MCLFLFFFYPTTGAINTLGGKIVAAPGNDDTHFLYGLPPWADIDFFFSLFWLYPIFYCKKDFLKKEETTLVDKKLPLSTENFILIICSVSSSDYQKKWGEKKPTINIRCEAVLLAVI